MGQLIVGLTVERDGACETDPDDCCPSAECCPDDPVPDTLYLEFTDATGDCDCLVSATLVYDADENAWIGTTDDCGTELVLMLECNGDTAEWTLTDDCGNTWAAQGDQECSPFALVFCTTAAGCPCTGDVCATITSISYIPAECCNTCTEIPPTWTMTVAGVTAPDDCCSETNGTWTLNLAENTASACVWETSVQCNGIPVWSLVLTDTGGVCSMSLASPNGNLDYGTTSPDCTAANVLSPTTSPLCGNAPGSITVTPGA